MPRLSTFGLIIASVALGAGGVAATTPSASAVGPARDRTGPAAVSALSTELQRSTDHTARITVRPGTGNVTFIGASSTKPLQPADGSDDDPGQTARRFVNRFGAMFGVSDARTELTQSAVFSAATGDAVRFQQRVSGVPVLAGQVAVQIDPSGAVVSSSGEASPRLSIDLQPSVPAEQATATALALTARADATATERLTVSTPELWVYDPSLIGSDDPLGPRLVWRMQVRTALGDVNRLVLVDAHDGTIALHFTQVEAAGGPRDVCDNHNDPALAETCTSPVILADGTGYGSASPDAQHAFDFTGQTYDFFKSFFNRDSVDGNGLFLHSTVRYCDPSHSCPYVNAFWNGNQMVYGDGYASADDVVGHELTHGLTQYTSNLLYYAESGAINESMSDVMGEFIDQQTPDKPGDLWLLGEDLAGGALRNMADPPSNALGGYPGDPDAITNPRFYTGLGDNRGVHANSGVNNKAAYLLGQPDGTLTGFNGQTVRALGITKTAKIYYQLETTLLGPGSDYSDLFDALPQACTNLLGVAGITTDDCQQVTKAVLATAMDQHPGGSAYFRTAPICDHGVPNGTQFHDDTSIDNGTWSSSTSGGGAPWEYVTDPSRTGGRMLHVADAPAPAGTSTLTGQVPITIPTGSPTYLRFDHSFFTDFEPSALYDGGVMEYSADNGASWNDLGPLAVNNGYNDVIAGGFANPLVGRNAFGTISPNFETTRLDLTPLAGQTIRLRFVFATDNYPNVDFPGWFIDDVTVYSCGDFAPLVPARLFDSRPGQPTTDGLFSGMGRLTPSTAVAVTVTGRGGVAPDASAVALNVTVTDAQGPGYLTVYPCGQLPPTASNLNYLTGSTIPNAVVSKVGANGQVCFFSQSAVHLAVDVNGYFPQSTAFVPQAPARLFDSRPGQPTVDGQSSGGGQRGEGTVTEVQVAGRAGLPLDAAAAVLNVTVTEAQAPGYATVYPCGSTPPTASNINYVRGSTIANAVIAKIGDAGKVCVFTQSAIQLVVDVSGYFPASSQLTSRVPARLLDTRPGKTTADGQSNGIGVRAPGGVTTVLVVGRVGVPVGATSAVLNVTVTEAQAPGYATVYPCGGEPPTASNLNYVTGSTIANAVIAKIGVNGTVCIYTQSATHLVVDVNGYFTG